MYAWYGVSNKKTPNKKLRFRIIPTKEGLGTKNFRLTYREYLNFLVINELVLMNENEQTLTITDMGKDFLRYIIESNLSSEKLN